MECRELLSTFVVSNTTDSATPATNSLRWAITQANADTTPDTIKFAIPGGGLQSIVLTSPLPGITNSVTIDGTGEQGYSGVPLIQIDGSQLGSSVNGLVLSGGQSTIPGLAVIGFSGTAIVLESKGSDLVAANYLGVNVSGNQAQGNGEGVLILGTSGNTIGGSLAAAGNVISGNSANGVEIDTGSGGVTGNLIAGNLIGTNASGSAALANGGAGIAIVGANGTTIGMPLASFSNVIAGNAGAGIAVSAGASGTLIENNAIGVASNSTLILGNGGDGILLDHALLTTIGGIVIHDGNLIGGNATNGIETLDGTTSLVQGNLIGTDATQTRNLGNRANGIQLASSSNTIGGTTPATANVIDNNGAGQIGSGVQLVGNVNQNTILSNSIFGNAGLGINLGDGPTPNHAPGTPGPNNYQNYPTLSSAQSNGTGTTVTGSLFSIPSTTFALQFFANSVAGPGGFGQGQTLIGSSTVTTDLNGNVNFTVPLPAGVAPGEWISATATDPSGNSSEFSADIQVKGQINLTLSGVAAPNPVGAGGKLTYTLTLTNTGTLAATNVTISDSLPASVTLTSATVSQGFVLPGSMGGVVSAQLGTLPIGATATMTIVTQTASNASGTIVDSATASSGGSNTVSTTITTAVVGSSDLGVVLTASPNPILAGADLTDTLTVTNAGPDAATGVVVTLPLATGMQFISAGPGFTVTNSGSQLTVNVGAMADNAQATVTLVLEPTVAGNLVQTASVSSTSIDLNQANNASTSSTVVDASADLGVSVSGSADVAYTVDEFTFTVTVSNNGPDEASGVVLDDTLPAGVSVESLSASDDLVPTESAGVVTLSIGTMSVGASVSLTVVVNPTVAPGTTMVNSAVVTGDQPDIVMNNNAAELNIPVYGVSDLGITGIAQTGPLYVGQPVTYTLTLTNSGPDDEPDAIVALAVPASVSVQSAGGGVSGAQPSVKGAEMTFDTGPLAAGATTTVTVVLVPQGGAAGTLATDFQVSGDNLDDNTANNDVPLSVTVAPAADLSIAIAPSGAPPAVDADWTYTLNVTNLGLSDASDVTVTSALSGIAGLVSVACSQGSYQVANNGTLTADLGTLAADASATITIEVDPDSSGPLPLSASVSGLEFDTNLANNQASASVPVVPSVDLSVALSPSATTIIQGKALTFTAVVQNTGPNPATGVAIAMPMPPGCAYQGSSAPGGTCGMSGGQFVAQFGTINPGSSATVTLVVIPSSPGTITQTAGVTSQENQLSPQNATSSTTVTVVESPGTLQFSTTGYTVLETAGIATISVVRTGGTRGAVSVNFAALAETATPGMDFQPVSGTLTFAAGQAVSTFTVPVLADPWDNHNETVELVLAAPSGGASLGTLSASQLTIVDINPDNTPPQVSQLSWSGNSKVISSITVTFNSPLNPTYAGYLGNFHLTVPSAGNATISLAAASYNAATHSVTLVPQAPLASGRFYEISVAGTGATAVRDLAGNLLDGASNGAPGSNYLALFGQGTKLQYVDNTGNTVSLKLAGGGYLQDILSPQGVGQSLTIVGETPRHTTLSGTIKRTKRSSGSTSLGTVGGLGNFGDVKVSLRSPPFLVKQYPFQQKGKGVL
jgi:uncharacterized repeat protein (TIGR01451 family)